MKKLMTATFLIMVLAILNSKAFALELQCKFSDRIVEGVESVVIREDAIFINETVQIPLEKSEINCSNFGRQLRFDGHADGYQVILKSCSADAQFEGILIDNIKQQVGDISCN